MDYTTYVVCFPNIGETINGISRYIQPGGKGNNQAVAIAKSNKVICTFLGAVGNDKDGKEVINILKGYNLNKYIKQIDEVNTGNATILVDSNGENKIVVVKGANEKLTKKDIPIELIEENDYILLQNELSSEVNEFVINKAKELGKVIIYNPAPVREVKKELFSNIDYLIVNEVELKQYCKENDIIKGANKLLANNVKNVIVTLGKEGSILVSKDIVIKVPANKVEAIDTVAAGDTYVGYFVSSLASGYSLKESMKFASKASAITVTRKGSLISIPLGKEVY